MILFGFHDGKSYVYNSIEILNAFNKYDLNFKPKITGTADLQKKPGINISGDDKNDSDTLLIGSPGSGSFLKENGYGISNLNVDSSKFGLNPSISWREPQNITSSFIRLGGSSKERIFSSYDAVKGETDGRRFSTSAIKNPMKMSSLYNSASTAGSNFVSILV